LSEQTRRYKKDILGGQEVPPSPFRPDSIPEDLKQTHQWVCWGWRLVDGKWGKIPLSPHGGNAKVNDPSTWGTFQQCLDYHISHANSIPALRTAGLMFAFSGNDPFCGVDLDDCRSPDTGEILPWGMEIINGLRSYSEVSPTGTGVKIIAKGKMPGDKHKVTHGSGEVEVYDSKRFFAITGVWVDGTPTKVLRKGKALAEVYNTVFGSDDAVPNIIPFQARQDNNTTFLTDEEVIQKCRAGKDAAKFTRLFGGDLSDFDGDDSRGDLSLCSLLARWTRDPAQIDRIFRSSKLMRGKWDRADYRDRTIKKALQGRGPAPQVPGGPVEPHLNDVGGAIRLVDRHGDDLRYSFRLKKWVVYDGTRWLPDETGEPWRRVKGLLRELYDNAIQKLTTEEGVPDE
jgi:putative DNA primase/helicase